MNATLTPTTSSATVTGVASSGTMSNYGSLATATASRASRTRARAWAIAVLVFAGGMDTFLAIPAFNGLLRGDLWQSWICAVAFSLIAVSSAYASGVLFKQNKRPTSCLAAVATVAMVIALFFLRIQAAAINSSTTSYEGGAPARDGAAAEVGISIVLAAAMSATAVLAWVDGYKITLTPAEDLFRSLDDRLARSNTLVAELEGEEVRLNENQAMAELRLQHLPAERDEALRGLEAFTRELRELARTEIVTHIGAPTATSGLDLPLFTTDDTHTAARTEGTQP